MDEEQIYLVSFECKKCGWDWIGMFAYCPHCRKSEVEILNYETMEEFAERMLELREWDESTYFLLEDYDWDE